jgi:hypothetical protein
MDAGDVADFRYFLDLPGVDAEDRTTEIEAHHQQGVFGCFGFGFHVWLNSWLMARWRGHLMYPGMSAIMVVTITVPNGRTAVVVRLGF